MLDIQYITPLFIKRKKIVNAKYKYVTFISGKGQILKYMYVQALINTGVNKHNYLLHYKLTDTSAEQALILYAKKFIFFDDI